MTAARVIEVTPADRSTLAFLRDHLTPDSSEQRWVIGLIARIDKAPPQHAALIEAAAAIRFHAQPANNGIRPSINAKHVYRGYELAAQIIDRMVADA